MSADQNRLAEDARQVCAEAYQAVGHLALLAGVFETDAVERLLDNLLAISEGGSPVHGSVLPFAPESERGVKH